MLLLQLSFKQLFTNTEIFILFEKEIRLKKYLSE